MEALEKIQVYLIHTGGLGVSGGTIHVCFKREVLERSSRVTIEGFVD